MGAAQRRLQGNHGHAAGGKQLPCCQLGLSVALGVHHHRGHPRAGVHMELAEEGHNRCQWTTSRLSQQLRDGLLCIAFVPECCNRDDDSLNNVYESGARTFPMLKPIAVVAAAGIVFAGAAQAIPLTARTVCVNCLGPRSDVLNPLEGTNDTPVPNGLIAGSGYTRDELQAGLTKSYSVDVVAVADFLYSDKGVQFLGDSIGQNNYTPYYSQQKALEAVRSAIILDSVDGQLSGFGMMNLLPVDERLQGAMNVCNVDASNTQRKTSLLSWYVNTPACIAAYTQVSESAAPAAPVRGLW